MEAAAAPVRDRVPGRRRRRITRGVLLVLVVLIAAAVALAAPGTHQTYPRTQLLWPAQQAHAPAWTRPCWPTARWTDKVACVHVRGRVVWTQKRDPDGDGDRHLLIVGRLHPRVVKLVRGMRTAPLPGAGTRVDAVGWLMRGGSGHAEVDAQRVSWGGQTWFAQAG
jgi:hypothetical protein